MEDLEADILDFEVDDNDRFDRFGCENSDAPRKSPPDVFEVPVTEKSSTRSGK